MRASISAIIPAATLGETGVTGGSSPGGISADLAGGIPARLAFHSIAPAMESTGIPFAASLQTADFPNPPSAAPTSVRVGFLLFTAIGVSGRFPGKLVKFMRCDKY